MKILEYKMVKVIEEPLPVCPYCMMANEIPEGMYAEIKCHNCDEIFEWNMTTVRCYTTWTKEPSK